MTVTSPPARAPGSGSGAMENVSRFDLLRVPVLGNFLKWRSARFVLQAAVLMVALVMVGHAFFGPDLAPKNLAALLTWVHFRGLVVLVLLMGGNFFCMACPFMLPRELARRWVSPRWNWPAKLRNKWPAIILFVAVLFFYEWLDLWSDPWATGMLIVGYFLMAFGVDLLFKRASFCKFVCPVGQFNFLGSTMSPLEVAVRDRNICADCRTRDCISGQWEEVGTASPRLVQRGCELELYQPRKVGNLDCTFCMDCVQACPHGNIGILARLPGEELAENGPRSGVGILEKRSDWTILSMVFVFGALLNAFAMVSPVYTFQQAVAQATGIRAEWPILGFIFALALVVEPLIALGGAAWLTRVFAANGDSLWKIVNRFGRTMVPIGFAVWLAHYGFHFFTGVLTVIPVTQSAVRSMTGSELLGSPLWQLGGLPESVVYPMEFGFLGLGLVGSLLVGWRVAQDYAPTRAMPVFAPWAMLSLAIFAAACWILSQPMDMRGTFVAA